MCGELEWVNFSTIHRMKEVGVKEGYASSIDISTEHKLLACGRDNYDFTL